MDFITVRYIEVVLPEAPQDLIVQQDGTARYVSYTNAQDIARPDIGIYEARLSPEAVSMLRKRLDKDPLADLPDHSHLAIPSGIESRTVVIDTPDGRVVKMVSRADPVDPRLEDVFSYLDDIVRSLIPYPRQVLRLETTEISVQAGGEMTVGLSVTNIGRAGLRFRNPADILRQGDGELTVEIWPAAPAPDLMWSEQKVFSAPAAATLEGGPPAGEARDPEAAAYHLGPGAAMTFRLAGRIGGVKGPHVGRVVYANHVDAVDGEAVMVGSVYTSTTEFEHPGSSAPSAAETSVP
jgi:hypothetical protein